MKMGLMKSRIRKKQQERIRKQAEQANIRKFIGADVSDDRIRVTAPAMKSGGEIAAGAVRALFMAVLRFAVFALCAIGLIAIIYPGPRKELGTILSETYLLMRELLGI